MEMKTQINKKTEIEEQKLVGNSINSHSSYHSNLKY